MKQNFKYWYHKDLNTYAPYIGFYLLPVKGIGYRERFLMSFALYGFKKNKRPYPYPTYKVFISLQILFIPFSFHIGIENKTWFYIKWEEVGILWHKFKHWLKREKGMPF